MPNTSLIPPKYGGNSTLIGAAALMLLAMGGLLFWKFGMEEPPPPPPPPIPSAKPAAVFEEAPPPPPPEPEDAGKKEEPKEEKKKVVRRKGGGGCSGECKGEATAMLRGALAGKAGQARGCYERALRQNSMLQGRMVVGVRVSSGGGVCSANVVSNTLGDPSVTSCVAQKFRSGTFPPPKGGCVDVQVPISFKPKTK